MVDFCLAFLSVFFLYPPPAEMKDLHERFCAAIYDLNKSCNFFMAKPSPQWTVAFLHSRRSYCHGLYELYDLRDRLPGIAAHFLMPGPQAAAAAAPAALSAGFSPLNRHGA